MNRLSAIGLALMISLFLAAIACSSESDETSSAPAPTAAPAAAPSGGTAFEVSLQDPGGSGSYVFSPADLTFSVGDTVSFSLTSEKEFHTFTVDDLGIAENVNAETTVDLTFTFDTAGTFELICVPHEALGMVGTITVQ
ncbi:MAG: cupredoxin domain-containing protein [SAR202 cluster bacterium]|nr:cupredoxin domain-containing protein [SAR202 cluster bacterium]MDP6511632.1 cupredoxin domain-containing protein [SAR202 cluster bacterium]